MSDRVEDGLRALLQRRAASVADGHDPVAAVESGVRRAVARRRLVAGAGLPMLVAAIVAGASLWPGDQQHRVTGGTALATVTPPASTTPALPTEAIAPVSPGSQTGPSASARASLPAPVAPVTSATSPPVSLPAPGSPQVEVYRRYLEQDPLPRELAVVALPFSGRLYCALRVLDQSTRYAYLWYYCPEYSQLKGGLKVTSASDGPVRLTITGQGAATRVTGAAVPHSGAPEQAELKALFSPLAFSRAERYQNRELGTPGLDESENQLRARAQADVQSGLLRAGLTTPAD